MIIETINISDHDKERIIRLEESHFLEIKSKAIKPSKLTRTLSAFCNSEGGEIYIGLGDDQNENHREWDGFLCQEDANGHIQIFEELFPLGKSHSYSFLRHNKSKGSLLYILVHKTAEIKKASDNKNYIRRGAQNLPLDQEGYQRLLYSKGITSFEAEIVNISLSEIANSEVIISFILEVVPSTEPELFLKKQMLIENGKPTVAGVILFSDEPQSHIPKRCGVKLYRYKTTDLVGSRDTLAFDPVTIEGCAYSQIHEAVKQTVEAIEDISVVADGALIKCTYPKITLHEIITNAVLHRDYSIMDDIHIRIFDNRVEVESPGKLPGHITTENILDPHFPYRSIAFDIDLVV